MKFIHLLNGHRHPNPIIGWGGVVGTSACIPSLELLHVHFRPVELRLLQTSLLAHLYSYLTLLLASLEMSSGITLVICTCQYGLTQGIMFRMEVEIEAWNVIFLVYDVHRDSPLVCFYK